VLAALDVIAPGLLADEHIDVLHRRVDRLVDDARDLASQGLLLFLGPAFPDVALDDGHMASC
jgi:hypothetical protein